MTSSPRLVLALLAFGGLISALDFTIVYVAMPVMADDVGFSAHSLQWVVSAYAILYGGFLLLGGRLSDLAGRRRMFVVGLALFGGASVLGGLATTTGQVIGARAIQGAGAAILFPATLALVMTTFAEGPARNRAMTVWAGAGAVGLSLGALLGGVLTELTGWQGVFFINVPLVTIAIGAAFALLAPDGPRERGGSLDVPGAVTGTAGATLLVLAIAQASGGVWSATAVGVTAAAAFALVALFVRIEARAKSPLLPLRMLRNRSLTGAMAVIFAFGLTLQAVPYFLTLYFQDVLGFSALEGGVAFLGPTLAITAGNLISERLIARFGTRTTLVLGMATGVAGAGLLVPAIAAEGGYLALLAGIVVTGLAMGLVFPAMFLAAAAGVAAAEHGTASGLASTALQVGGAAGLAVLVSIAGAGDAAGIAAAVAVVAVGAIGGATVAAAGLPGGERAAAPHQAAARDSPAAS